MTDRGKILAFPDAAVIETEAAAWVARFDAGDVSARDQADFQEWLSRSTLHRDAIAEYGDLWSAFDALGSLAAARESGAPNSRSVLKAAAPWLAACAAAVIVVVGGVAALHIRSQQRPVATAKAESPARLSYETAIGSRRKIILADGSSVVLNTNSRLDVDFSANRRDVRLARGEAFFEVVHDRNRPFTVHADHYMVRDIGTAFDVHLSKAGRVEVGVIKGQVEVVPAAGAPAAAKSLGVLVAGQNIVLGEKIARAEAVPSADMGRKLAWRQGELIYTGQPLGEVLADISRYSDIKIELADPELERLPVGGAFRIDQIAAIFTALENNFGVRAEWIDARHVRFTSRPEGSPVRE